MDVTQEPVDVALPTFVGRYRVGRVLGRGSFAVVVLAWDEELESAVALKILRVKNPETETRFLKEARLLRRVQSLNVISVHDSGRLADGSPYFVLDYASHGTLEERLVAGLAGPLLATRNPLQLLNFVDGLADGLTAMHNAGMVHRDIKPANVLFCSSRQSTVDNVQSLLSDKTKHNAGKPYRHLVADGERVLVGDLGIAKDLCQIDADSTLLGGTPYYIAPEQLKSDESVTPAADTYSATALLWRTLVAETPPTSDDVGGRLKYLPQALVRQGWAELFDKGLATDVADRYQSADDLRWAVHEVVGSGSSTIVHSPGTGSVKSPQIDICPYKGLAAYEAGDSRFFCGRESLVDQLCRRLQLESVLVVGGPSGSGKSSLVRAGMIPSLRAGILPGSEEWQCLLMTPGSEPMQSLRDCLAPVGGITDLLERVDDSQSPPVVLVVDQLEEIFTLIEDSSRDEFLQALTKLVSVNPGSVKLTLVVRADFYAECAREPWLAAKITGNQVLVGPMTESELQQAITEPAREAGYLMEKELVTAIVREAGNETGSLPLVAHALVETWVRRTDNTLTLEGFHASGGVAGAISQTADATYEHKLDDNGRDATRRLMLQLVNPGDGTPDTRRVVDRDDIQRLSDNGVESTLLSNVIKKLTDARLLTVDEKKVQIAHEALLRSWPRLLQWIDESRDDLRMRRKISLHAEEWQSEGQESDQLYHGTRLHTVLEWHEDHPDQLGVLESSFLNCSKQRQQDIDEGIEQGRLRTRRLWAVAISLLALLAIGATLSSLFAFRAYRDSQHNQRIAEEATEEANVRFAGALGAAAYGNYEEDPRLSLVLAAEAQAKSYSSNSETPISFDTRAALVSARQVLASGGAFLLGSPIVAGDAMSIALNPQGSILTIGNVDGEVLFMDVATRRELQPGRRDHIGGVRDLEFSPDGKSLVSAGADGRLLLWRADDKGIWQSKLLGETGDVVPDIDFHPGGKFVLSANHDATITKWYLDETESQNEPFIGGTADINTVAISQDGRYMVAGNADKTVSGWDIRTGELLMGPLKGVHSSHLRDVVFAPSGDHFFTMTTDGESKSISFPDGQILDTLFGSTESVGVLLVNSKKDQLLGGTNHGQLASWDISSGAIIQRSAAGHSQIIKHASMTLDERLIATLGRDHLIRFWTINDNYPMGQQLQAKSKAAKSVAISPDGTLMASGDADGAISLWRLDLNDAPITLTGHAGQVWALAFSPDGRLLASADRRGKVQVWDVIRRRIVQIINVGSDAIWSVEFEDNDELMVASEVGINCYSVSEGKLLEHWDTNGTQITRMDMSSDRSTMIITYANGEVWLEDVTGAAPRKVVNVGDDLLWSAALNHSKSMLAVASSDETVSLFDVASGELLSKLTGHQGGATNVVFVKGGNTLVVSDRRGSLHWWDIDTERRLAAPWRGHKKAVWRMALHPDGSRFATAGDDGYVWIWDTLSIKQACEIGYPGFDEGQKKQYLGDDHTMQACQ